MGGGSGYWHTNTPISVSMMKWGIARHHVLPYERMLQHLGKFSLRRTINLSLAKTYNLIAILQKMQGIKFSLRQTINLSLAKTHNLITILQKTQGIQAPQDKQYHRDAISQIQTVRNLRNKLSSSFNNDITKWEKRREEALSIECNIEGKITDELPMILKLYFKVTGYRAMDEKEISH